MSVSKQVFKLAQRYKVGFPQSWYPWAFASQSITSGPLSRQYCNEIVYICNN